MKNKILALFLISGFSMMQADLTAEQQARLDNLLQTNSNLGKCLAFRILEQNFKMADKSKLSEAVSNFFEEKIENMKCPELQNIGMIATSFDTVVQDFCDENNMTKQEVSALMKIHTARENLLFKKELEQYLRERNFTV